MSNITYLSDRHFDTFVINKFFNSGTFIQGSSDTLFIYQNGTKAVLCRNDERHELILSHNDFIFLSSTEDLEEIYNYFYNRIFNLCPALPEQGGAILFSVDSNENPITTVSTEQETREDNNSSKKSINVTDFDSIDDVDAHHEVVNAYYEDLLIGY